MSWISIASCQFLIFLSSPVLAYGQSKLANILFSAELDKRLNGSGVTSNSLHPGGITSGLQRYIVDAYSGTEESLFRTVLSRVHALSSAIASLCVLMTPEDGALTQLYVASAPELAGVSGKYFVPVTRTSTPSHHVLNETLREKLWDWSEKKVAKYLPKK